MRLRASAVAGAVGGRLVGGDIEVDGAGIDSRRIGPGQLFVPVVAERDGHDFVAAAIASGAVLYLTSRGEVAPGTPRVEVADTGAALLALGAHARGRLPDQVVGITGSMGKTTVKDLTAAVLAVRYSTAASERSFNNELGVPLTLFNAPEGTEATVVEMGARAPGHIRSLCAVARPTMGVVTLVAPVHTETFGSVEGVARAKAELVEAIPASGVVVLNADDTRVAAMASLTPARVITYSSGGGGVGADLTAGPVATDDDLRLRFRLRSPWGQVEVHPAVRGAHHVGNVLAAAAVGLAAGLTTDEVALGLAAARHSPWRMELRRAPSGAVVVNDAYNANPASVEAALRSLVSLPASRWVAVLGPMAELGPDAPAQHRRVAAFAGQLGVEVIAVDSPDYGPEPVTGVEGALAELRSRRALEEGVAVLV
ncbi:MAG TPA: UDP-N-acetylmuramoyl-tripeptide--D-alanyl-D-alanine ligase, partial [Acidimicrobiales bacterium]|nr:UDP-N-acetylmuramoyl-tripeptide--D-alanyl-D-alanine ligase [Acidimicrobiales bacterium]